MTSLPLYMIAVELNQHADADIVYADEDALGPTGKRHDPCFKPDWNRDLIYGQNMVVWAYGGGRWWSRSADFEQGSKAVTTMTSSCD